MPQKLLKRNEVPIQDTWNLSDIYADMAVWENDYAKVSAICDEISAYHGKLSDRDSLLNVLKLSSDAQRISGALFVFARMHRDEDNSNSEYQALAARAASLGTKLGSACSFISSECLSQDEAYLAAVRNDPEFSDFDIMLDDLLRHRPHTLSENEEMLLALSRDMGSTSGTIFDMLTDADMKFPEIDDGNGSTVALTHGNFISFMMSRDVNVRKAAFEAMYNTFKSFSATIPAIYAANVKSDVFYAKASKHSSSLSASLFPDNIPESVYTNLIDAVHDHLPGLQKFFNINASLNGIDKMHFYDLYCAPEMGFDIKLPFKEAYALVIDCLKVLGEDYTAVLKRALEERWIDPYENESKSSGAYSWGTYDSHPYVLMNYKENLKELQTIAHEMGHSLHTYYSDMQPYTKSEYSLFIAEVASTVNEVLVLSELLNRYTDDNAQSYLLYNLLDSFRGTVFRQTMFAEFEKTAHEMEENGVALTVDSLNKVYADLNKEYYANLEFDELISYEWMRIPHFYRSFYVYKYATGFSAAIAIAGKIRREGEPAVKAYKQFLSAGSSMYPLDALKLAGVDLSSSEPVRAALDEFDALLVKYETVCARRKA